MSISSLSLSLVNRAAPTPAAPAGVQLAPAPAPLPVADDRHEKHGAVRPKGMYNAILSALRDLGMTAAPPAPVGTAASADAAPAAAATPSVKGAVFEFTSALFQALGGAGESVGGEEHHPNHGRGHAYAYGRTWNAWSRDGYAGLAGRLEGLAASLPSPATPAAPAAPTAPTAPTAPSPQVASEASATAPAAEAPATPATTPVTTSTGRAPEPTPIDAPVSIPLVNAFDGLLQALHVPVAAGSSGSEVAAGLASFLHSLAQALQPTPAEQVAPATGMLLNETA